MCHLVVLAFPGAINHSHGTLASFDLIKILKKEKVFLVFIEKGWSFVSVSSGALGWCDLPTLKATLCTSELSCVRLCLPTHPSVSLLNREAYALFIVGTQSLHAVHQLLILKTRLSSC